MGSTQTATLGDDCFWCVRAAFKKLDGTSGVTSGYAGGETKNPSYGQVYSGSIGYVEVVQIDHDPAVVGYDELLDVFFAVHDPTQLSRQGLDVGTQYHSIVLFHDDEQKRRASAYIDALDKKHDDEMVTELVPLETFYKMEKHHQDYPEKVSMADGSTNDAYCQFNIVPKIEKVQEKSADKAKAEAEPDA